VKLSVITATYNRQDFLPRCIESVAAQSYPDKEHIIIDGGSTDGTVSLLGAYAARYSHLRWISEKDNGISSALNKGFALATGDAIGIIGDDDSYEPEVFGIIASEFELDQEIGVVSGNCNFVGNDGLVCNTQTASYTCRKDLIQGWLYWGSRIRIAAPSTFIRRRVIDEVGGFDEADHYAMDYHHWLKITGRFPKIKTVDRVFANFRLDEGTVSFSSNKEQWEEMLTISKKHWGPKTSRMYYEMLYSYLKHYGWPRFKNTTKRSILRIASLAERKP
jgi:glycosyltransferase involved in cell wall biosynthesis